MVSYIKGAYPGLLKGFVVLMELKYLLYFIVGGIITSLVTYLANHAKSLLAAFVGTLPVITISTFLLIYFNTGQEAVVSYAKGLLIMIVPWIVFILSVILLAPRIRFFYSLMIGLSLQIILAFLIMRNVGTFYRP